MLTRDTELKNCTYIKTVLMLSIVLYHSMLYWCENWFVGTPAIEVPLLAMLAGWLNSFHIYAFALVSGYIFYYIKHERAGYKEFLPFARKKALRLLVPYVFAAMAWVMPINGAFSLLSLKEVFPKFVLA